VARSLAKEPSAAHADLEYSSDLTLADCTSQHTSVDRNKGLNPTPKDRFLITPLADQARSFWLQDDEAFLVESQ
jgi:hypothetical protein